MSLSYTYIYSDPTRRNEPFYVGKGKGLRAYSHLSRTDNHPVTNRIKNIRNKGSEPIVEKIKVSSEYFAIELEKGLIKYFGRRDLNKGPLLNLTDGGEGTSGIIWSEEVKKKRGLSQRGKKISKETRQRLSNTLKKPEILKKLSDAGKKSRSLKNRLASAEYMRNRIITEEFRTKMSKIRKELHRKKMGISGLGV